MLTATLLLVASAGYAPCYTPQARHVEYWQIHYACTGGHCILPGYHTLDGTCDTDCEENTSCSGDTHIDSNTEFVLTTEECTNQICT
jgi:hypothetical protein